MVDSVNVSNGHVGTALENARTFRYGGHSLGWVVPNTETILADVRDGLSAGPYNAFAESHTSSSTVVTVDTGEAVVGGVPLARDATTDVDVGTNRSAATIYVGWAVQAKDRVVIGEASAFTADDPKIPLWDITTDGSGVTGVSDRRELDETIDVQNRRYEGGSGAKVDAAKSADKIDGVTIGNLLRTDQNDSISGKLGFTNRGSLANPLGKGDGEFIRYGGVSSDLTMNIQGGHGRVMWAWNAYYDQANSTWRSINADELHACIGMVNNHPGYGSFPSSIVFGTSGKNAKADAIVDWNWTGIDQYGNFDLGGNQLKNASLETRDNRPSNPKVGRIIYRTDQDDNLTY